MVALGGILRLTVSAAKRFARGSGMSTREFLDGLARRTRETRSSVEGHGESPAKEKPSIAVLDLAA